MGQTPFLGVDAPLVKGVGGLSKNLWGRYRPVRCLAAVGREFETGSRGGVVTTGIDTLADDAGREGFRILDGPASSKLTHSIEELWEPGR